ncbi:MAG TPA: redoxin domain-containing protein [Candidatus Eremiobacteraceae bacterium]|nr:redoxin domain-containing protein [Candidatus Eremiobacteraceae bacterium]
MIRGRSAIGACSLSAAILMVCLGQANLVQAQSAFDLEGKSVNPLSASPGKIVVLVFLRRDCPVSSRYAPVIQKISAEHEREANFWLIFPDKAETSPEIRKYLLDYSYRLPALRDPDHVLVKLGQAEITPEVAVFDNNGHLVYHGRIDDWYVEFGRSRPAPTTHELNDAIEAALSGKSPAHSAVKGVGCYISDLE